MDRWEYKQFTASHNQEARPGLNNLGYEGWECFAAIADHQYTYFYLKRRVELPGIKRIVCNMTGTPHSWHQWAKGLCPGVEAQR